MTQGPLRGGSNTGVSRFGLVGPDLSFFCLSGTFPFSRNSVIMSACTVCWAAVTNRQVLLLLAASREHPFARSLHYSPDVLGKEFGEGKATKQKSVKKRRLLIEGGQGIQ